MTARNLLNMINQLEAIEAETEAIEAAWDENPESEELEAAFDASYQAEGVKAQEIAKAISAFTAGMVDERTARRMLTIKREELRSLCQRAA